MARLGQLYLVDMTSRVIDFRLHFQKNIANHFHGGQQWRGNQTESGAVEDIVPSKQFGRDATAPSYISQSLHGSRRHLREKAKDALFIVSE
jgi:hypothetical protein